MPFAIIVANQPFHKQVWPSTELSEIENKRSVEFDAKIAESVWQVDLRHELHFFRSLLEVLDRSSVTYSVAFIQDALDFSAKA